jgi:hypothetical protein
VHRRRVGHRLGPGVDEVLWYLELGVAGAREGSATDSKIWDTESRHPATGTARRPRFLRCHPRPVWISSKEGPFRKLSDPTFDGHLQRDD